jgi:hypothetical protein
MYASLLASARKRAKGDGANNGFPGANDLADRIDGKRAYSGNAYKFSCPPGESSVGNPVVPQLLALPPGTMFKPFLNFSLAGRAEP